VSICNPETATNLHVTEKGAIAFQTVQAKINIPGKPSVPCRMLLDTGSDKTYMVQRIANKLQGRPIRHEIKMLDTVHGSKSHRCAIYHLEVRNMQGEFQFNTEAATLSKLTTVSNARPEVVQQKFEHLKDIKFSDVSEKDELEVHVIIGLEDLGKLKTGRYIRGEENQPVAEETKLGWTLLGPTFQGTKSEGCKGNLLFCMDSKSEMAAEVEKLWDLETVGIREGDPVHSEFKDTVTFNGMRYVVKLPWKSDLLKAPLPDNKFLSEKRLKSQIKKLSANDDLEAYDNIIKEQLKAGIIEEVPENTIGKQHYIPHHAVIRREAETTKVRVVFDASSKERKRVNSLNDRLNKGPSLLPMLYDVLLRFRMHPVALVGDIQKAFHQIEVAEDDRDCLRFLWLKDSKNVCSDIIELRFSRVVFGAAPSPFLLNATIQVHLEKYKMKDPEFVNSMLRSLYVDDFVGGGRSHVQVMLLQKELTDVMHEGGFNLHKWKSSSEEVRKSLSMETDKDDEETYAKQSLTQENCQSKVLGVQWNPERDVMSVELSPIIRDKVDQRITKRELLSAIAKVYDPLGVMSPVMIVARKIFQDVCKQGTVWDSPVTQDIQERWDIFLQHVNRRSWRLGKVTALLKGRDERIRAVKLHVLSQGKLLEIDRPLQGIASLELKGPLQEAPGNNSDVQVKRRPKRIATFAGEEARELQTDLLNQED